MPLPRRTGAGILSLRHFLFLEGTEFPIEAKLGGPSKALSRSLAERSKLTACAARSSPSELGAAKRPSRSTGTV